MRRGGHWRKTRVDLVSRSRIEKWIVTDLFSFQPSASVPDVILSLLDLRFIAGPKPRVSSLRDQWIQGDIQSATNDAIDSYDRSWFDEWLVNSRKFEQTYNQSIWTIHTSQNTLCTIKKRYFALNDEGNQFGASVCHAYFSRIHQITFFWKRNYCLMGQLEVSLYHESHEYMHKFARTIKYSRQYQKIIAEATFSPNSELKRVYAASWLRNSVNESLDCSNLQHQHDKHA